MEKKNFFEEVALACTEEANKVRQTMYLIMHSETTIGQTKEEMIKLIAYQFVEKIDDRPKLYALFTTRIGYTDRECSQPSKMTLIFELISSSLSFPQKEKGFTLGPVGHYFKEEDILEIYGDFDSFSRAISQMNEKSFAGQSIVKTFKGPNTHGGKLIELYFCGGHRLINEVKKKH